MKSVKESDTYEEEEEAKEEHEEQEEEKLKKKDEEEIDHEGIIRRTVDRKKTQQEKDPKSYPYSSVKNPNMGRVPSDAILYSKDPPKIDYYDMFYFETIMREIVQEILEPQRKASLEDKEKAAQLRLDYNILIERVHELECYALIQEWKLKPSKQIYALLLKILAGE